MIPTEEQALSILKREGASEIILAHCVAVRDYAKEVSGKISGKLKINVPAVLSAALLHDIGRTKTTGPEHGVVGAKIARSYGVDDSVCLIIERHVGAGFTDADAANLGLPLGKIYLPLSIEEKIVSYCEKKVYPGGIATNEEAIASFEAEIGKGDSLERLRNLLSEVDRLAC